MKFFQRAFVQIFFVGLLAFCCPGMFNALNGLGKAGGSSEHVAAAANAALYACFAVFGYFGGAFFNLLGNRALMSVGGLTYCFYAVGQYVAAKYAGFEWLAILSGAVLGFGAGWFWTAQGAMMMAYATPEKRGSYIGIFWIIFNLGGMMGGFLSFGLNYASNEESQASAASYFTFVIIMGAGALGALLLAHPSKVIREDGEPVVFEKAKSAAEEIKGVLAVATNKYMLLMFVLFLSSNWFYTYQFNGVNGTLFNIRTRGLNSALYWASQMVGAWGLGKMLDLPSWSTRKRGFFGFAAAFTCFNIAYSLGCILQYGYEGGWDKDSPIPLIDFKDSRRSAFPMIVYLLYGISDAMLQTFAYWVMGAVAQDDASLCARFAGFYKGVQSLGAAVAWSLDLKLQYKPQFWVGWALFLAACIPLFFAIRDIQSPKARFTDDNSKLGGTDSIAKPEHSQIEKASGPSDLFQMKTECTAS